LRRPATVNLAAWLPTIWPAGELQEPIQS